MTSLPPPASGIRLPWAELPPRIPAALEGWLNGRIETVTMQPGGFSPGVAARVQLTDGRRVFVKAVGPELNPDTPRIFRREARVVAALPKSVSAPRLLWLYDEGPGGWVMLVFEDVEGWNPATPWQPEELDRVVNALVALSAELSPSPIEAPSASDQFASQIRGWARLRDNPPVGLDAWSFDHLDRLVELEEGAPEAARGNTLLHFDIRADNILLTPDRVLIVDWPNACVGASWIELACFLPSVAMQGGPPPKDVLMRHPAARAASPSAITSVIAALSGFFLYGASLPPPPGLPTLRAFQAAQGVEALRWLRARLEWYPV